MHVRRSGPHLAADGDALGCDAEDATPRQPLGGDALPSPKSCEPYALFANLADRWRLELRMQKGAWALTEKLAAVEAKEVGSAAAAVTHLARAALGAGGEPKPRTDEFVFSILAMLAERAASEEEAV